MKLIVWDFDGTLASREGMWTGTLCEILADRAPDFVKHRDDIRAKLQNGFPWHQPELAHPELSYPDDWWEALFPVFTQAFLAVGIAPTLAELYAREVRSRYVDPKRWSVFPDCVPDLEELSQKGWTHVILSNHVPELARLVCDLGLSRYFLRISSSATTGYEKPNPLSYASAVAGLDELREVWMIGDSYDFDFAGPLRFGWEAILVRKSHPEAHRFTADLSVIPKIIEPNHPPEPTRAIVRSAIQSRWPRGSA